MAILIFIIILSFLVIIHELGHFLAAKLAGVRVEEFGFGYPPKAIRLFTWRGTEFTLNIIPFGGFVRLAGEEAHGLLDKLNLSHDLFFKKPALKRLIVILAGVAVNFIFGILAFSIVFSLKGIPTTIKTARIVYIQENSPAAQAGMKINTEIIKFVAEEKDFTVSTFASAQEFIAAHQGQTVTVYTTGTCQDFACEENLFTYQVYLKTEAQKAEEEGSLGVAFAEYIPIFYPWWQMPFRAAWYGTEQALFLGLYILLALGDLIRQLMGGVIPQDVAGPIGIVHQASQQKIFEEGFLAMLNFAGMLSVNLAIMNLLPIPALDGGRAAFVFIARIVGKKRAAKWENYANYAGYALLLSLIVLVSLRDIKRVWGV